MTVLSYRKALNRALADELAADPSVFVLGEDVRAAATHVTAGLSGRFGDDRVIDAPLSEQAFTSFATGAAMAGLRPVLEFAIPSLLFLVFEQIVNHAHKFSLMTGGQTRVPVTYLFSGSGSRTGWAGQHSDQPYSLLAHVGVKTVVPATPADAYGLLRSAIADDDPVAVFAPAGVLSLHTDEDFAALAPVPLGSALVRRCGTDVTVVAVGHLVHEALAVAEELAGRVSVEVFDPRTLHPFDWDGLLESVRRTRRLVVLDDSNRSCGIGAEIVTSVVEQVRLLAAPRRVSRPDGAVLPFAQELDRVVQPDRALLVTAIDEVMEEQ